MNFRARAAASMGGGMRRAPRLPVDLEGSLRGRVVHPIRLLDLSLTGCDQEEQILFRDDGAGLQVKPAVAITSPNAEFAGHLLHDTDAVLLSPWSSPRCQ